MGIEGGPKFNPEEQDPPTPKTETEKVKNIGPETKKTGGIIPEIAAREQVKYIIPVINRAIEQCNN